MRKYILITILAIFLTSCSLFGIKLDHSNFKIETAHGNEEVQLKVKNWGNNLLMLSKEELENNKKNNIKIEETPRIFSIFNEYKDKGIVSLVYEIDKNISKDFPQKIVKIFHTNELGEEIKTPLIKTEEKKDKTFLENKLKSKINSMPGVYKDKEFISDNVRNYIENMNFYFINGKVIFLFETNQVADYSEGIIKVEFDFLELAEVLNPEIFPEVKVELERKAKEAEKKRLERKNTNVTPKEALALNGGKKYVALTFDDGPNNKTTPQLLDILKKHDVKATFFVLGKMASIYPEVLKREYEEGHEIASHSWDHPNFMTLSKEAIKKQINSTDEEIKKIIGIKPNLMRPPYGAHNKNIDNIIGKTIVMWNVDSMDWKHRNVTKNLNKTMREMTNGSIVLFHDIHQPTVDTIEPLIKKLKEQGYEFLTVSELLEIGQNGDFEKKVCHSEFNCYNY